MNEEKKEKSLTTADLLAVTEIPMAQRETGEEGQLAALFLPDVAKDFRSRWDAVQISFVDDPRLAVQQADELVAQVMKSLAETFSSERTKLEAQVDLTDKASTENLRLVLRRYRSFFERLLSL
jgi:hypothetical protein